jgi:phenylacetic acid degradation operon negative regulatory protein
MPVSALVAAGGLFGIGDGSVRVAVTRLVAAGRIERDERGCYRLGAAAEPVDRQVRAWRRLEERTRRWDGSWLAVHTAALPRARGSALARRRRALRLLGFETLLPGLALRPDNLRGGADAVRGALADLGLGAPALVARLRDLDPASDARARGLWDAPALEAGYQRSLREVEASGERLPRLPEAEAMVESFLLGGRVIRQLVLDPLLPEPVVAAGPRRALVEAMRRYDRIGRRCWSGFMERVGAPQGPAPADTRMADGAARWALRGEERR